MAGGPPREGSNLKKGRHRPQHLSRQASRRRLSVRRASGRTRALALLSAAAVIAGLGIFIHIGAFFWHTRTAGGALLHQEQAAIAAGGAGLASHSAEFDQPRLHLRSPATPPPTTPADCTTPGKAAPAGQPQGIIEAKSIGLQAPVVEGVGDDQLSVAVGHVPGSVWPGANGTTVFSAHDVSWFSGIDKLKPGSLVHYVTPCQTYTYKVTTHAIVTAGSPVTNTATPTLVLDTCYPLDALWITPKRYLVYADEVQVQRGGQTTALPTSTSGTLRTSLPAAVSSDVNARLTTSAPLGAMTLTGNATPAWRQSIKPINGSGTALSLYFGALELAGNADTAGWAEAAPGLGAGPSGPIGPLWGAQVTGNIQPVAPTLHVRRTHLTGVTVSSTITVSGGSAPGNYRVTMQGAMEHGVLTVTGWQMTPA